MGIRSTIQFIAAIFYPSCTIVRNATMLQVNNFLFRRALKDACNCATNNRSRKKSLTIDHFVEHYAAKKVGAWRKDDSYFVVWGFDRGLQPSIGVAFNDSIDCDERQRHGTWRDSFFFIFDQPISALVSHFAVTRYRTRNPWTFETPQYCCALTRAQAQQCKRLPRSHHFQKVITPVR